MKRLLLALSLTGTLVGCATPAQNAALAGAAVGVLGTTLYHDMRSHERDHRHHKHHHHHRPQHCWDKFVGYDVYRRPLYQRVCR